MLPWWVKIPTEGFTDKTLVINDTYGSGVWEIVIMEVDKVADEVADMMADMGVDKVVDMGVKIPIEDFT